jgi:hypothetical protein
MHRSRTGVAATVRPVPTTVRERLPCALPTALEERLVRAEIEERQTAARVSEEAGRDERARRLRHEADLLAAVAGLPHAPAPPAER